MLWSTTIMQEKNACITFAFDHHHHHHHRQCCRKISWSIQCKDTTKITKRARRNRTQTKDNIIENNTKNTSYKYSWTVEFVSDRLLFCCFVCWVYHFPICMYLLLCMRGGKGLKIENGSGENGNDGIGSIE